MRLEYKNGHCYIQQQHLMTLLEDQKRCIQPKISNGLLRLRKVKADYQRKTCKQLQGYSARSAVRDDANPELGSSNPDYAQPRSRDQGRQLD